MEILTNQIQNSQNSGLAPAPEFPLGLLQMRGSFPLNDQAIDAALDRAQPGNYALGYMDGATFSVCYVGRSDADLRHDLHEWVGAPSRDRYPGAAKAAWDVAPGKQLPFGAPRSHAVGSCADGGYTRFAFSYALSADAAFDEECRNYDDFGRSNGLDNPAQPVPPARAASTPLGVVLRGGNRLFG